MAKAQSIKARVSPAFCVHRANLAGVQAVEADTTFSFGRHTHDQFGIGLIGRGAQTSLSGRGVVEARAGDIITVNPGEVHDGAPIDEGGRSWKMLYFDPETIAAVVRDMTDGRTGMFELSHPVVRDPEAASRFRSLFAAMTTDVGTELPALAEECLFLLLDTLVVDAGPVERSRTVPPAIAKARSRMNREPAEPISLDDLALLCGLSRFQVLRGFTKDTGFTPHAYLIQRRLQMARRLILQGVSLAEVAISSGFADQSHMTRLFARTYGMSPGSYAMAVK